MPIRAPALPKGPPVRPSRRSGTVSAVHASATTGGLHTMLGDLDEAIRALFVRELDARGIDGTGVSFAAPTAAWAEALEAPALNLYLYTLAESRAERRVEWEQADVGGRTIERPPPVLIDVSYVITAWADTPEQEHGLLSAALAVAYAHPALPDDVRTGALAEDWAYEHQLRTRVAQPPGEGFGAAFWAALGGRHKASVDFGVGVWCRPGGEVDQAPPVRTQTLRMGMRGRPAAGVEELHRISGAVHAKDGEAAAGAWVVLPDTGGFAVTDADGRFTLASVRAGRHRLRVRSAAGAEADASVEVPGEEIELELG
jgi:Pvc16 N-terminal domain/Carboxypeptidase regulatory-like domain